MSKIDPRAWALAQIWIGTIFVRCIPLFLFIHSIKGCVVMYTPTPCNRNFSGMRAMPLHLTWEMHAEKGEFRLFSLIWYTLACILPQPGAWVKINILSEPSEPCNCSSLLFLLINHLICLHQLWTCVPV